MQGSRVHQELPAADAVPSVRRTQVTFHSEKFLLKVLGKKGPYWEYTSLKEDPNQAGNLHYAHFGETEATADTALQS